MRILYVVNTYPDHRNPAAEPFVKAQIDSVRKAGAFTQVLNISGFKNRLNYLKVLYKLYSIIQKDRFDIVHGHYVYSGWIAALQGKAPSVVSFMGSDLIGRRNKFGDVNLHGKIDIHLSKKLSSFIDGVVVKSEEMAGLLSKTKRTIVLPNGVDFEMFKPMPKYICKKELGLEGNCLIVLHIGKKNCLNKGYNIASEAVRLLSEKVRITLVNVNGMAHERMPLFMNASDVLVLPSLYEGSPNVVKEALACNLPVVATDVGDVRKVIGEIPGCLIAERTPEAFSKAIEECVEFNRPFTGRQSVEHLRSDRIALRLLEFYEDIILRRK